MKEKEIWKDIPGYEDYQISNLGNIKSKERNFIRSNGRKQSIKETLLKKTLNKNGYLIVSLFNENKQKTKKIHQLVAICFLNHIPCGMHLVVNHKNFDKTDNRVENLEIVTSRENSNRKHIKSSSKYTGVSWYKSKNKWVSKIVINRNQINLGYFENEYEAHLAYESAINRDLEKERKILESN